MKMMLLNGSPRKDWNTAKMLNGTVEVHACCDTLQVDNYSKYNMASFDEQHKIAMREKQFPEDLKKAFTIGAKLGSEVIIKAKATAKQHCRS